MNGSSAEKRITPGNPTCGFIYRRQGQEKLQAGRHATFQDGMIPNLGTTE